MSEYGSFSKEVAISLEINPNTLRRWSLELEKQGYSFSRNEKDQRIYYDRDILTLNDFRKLLEKTQSLENAAKAAVKRASDKVNAEKTLSVIGEESDKITLSKEHLEELIERSVKKAVEEEREAMFKIFEHKMNSMIESRDSMLMESIRTAQETKQLLLATKEEQQEQKKPRKGLLKWFIKE
jgi:DNA-binding transcriptional regulator YhcF (GntR family)